MNDQPFIRPVCRSVNDAVGKIPSGPFNFGLYFQKWFFVSTSDWACPARGASQQKSKSSEGLDNLADSLRLFNGDSVTRGKTTAKWDQQHVKRLLKEKHDRLDACVRAFEALNYVYMEHRATLRTPLIIGLGNEHPSEKGFRFDWNLGIPAIPGSSIKGVVRLAHMIHEVTQDGCPDDDQVKTLEKGLTSGQLPDLLAGTRHAFGNAGDETASRGKVVFLDAYPLTLPRLKAEIMNCHYRDYLTTGKRGPTEDQEPNPQKYWAVDIRDHRDKELEFVFRVLMDGSLAADESAKTGVERALIAALQEHGLGAKTAVGHGGFKPSRALEDSSVQPKVAEPTITWETATLAWNAGTSTLKVTARSGESAEMKGFELVPSGLQEKLKRKKKRKAVTATVRLERVGPNYYKIISISDTEDTSA